MKGLSVQQLVVLLGCFLALVSAVSAALAEQWKLAVLAAGVSYGLFVTLVVFTLGAVLRATRQMRGRIRAIDRDIRQNRHIAAGVRRIDNRTAERFKALDSTQDRIEAAERRLLATLEAHRFQLEDQLAELSHLSSVESQSRG